MMNDDDYREKLRALRLVIGISTERLAALKAEIALYPELPAILQEEYDELANRLTVMRAEEQDIMLRGIEIPESPGGDDGTSSFHSGYSGSRPPDTLYGAEYGINMGTDPSRLPKLSVDHQFRPKVFMFLATCRHCEKHIMKGLKCDGCGLRCHERCQASIDPVCATQRDDHYYKHLLSVPSPAAPGSLAPTRRNEDMRKISSAPDLANGRYEMVHEPPTPSNPGSSAQSDVSEFADLYEGDADQLSEHYDYQTGDSDVTDGEDGGDGDDDDGGDGNGVIPRNADRKRRRRTSSSTSKRSALSAGHAPVYGDPNPQSDWFRRASRFGSSGALVGAPPTGEHTALTTAVSGLSGSTPASEGADGEFLRRDSDDASSDANGSMGSDDWGLNSMTRRQEWEIPYSELVLQERIGSGSFGTVFKGKWHGTVAVKKLNVVNPTEAQLDAFRNEVAVLRKTRHDNIVLFMGACTVLPDLAIVTKWCEGSTLFTHVHVKEESFDLLDIVNISRQIAQGMEYLHAKSIIHRDLKSSNVFLDADRKVNIGDFGLSTVKSVWIDNVCLNQPTGSILWMAPEVISMAPDPYTPSSDVYSYGIVLYELLTGRLPYRGMHPDQILFMVGRGILKPDIKAVRADCPPALVTLMTRCWDRAREQRPVFRNVLAQLRAIHKHLSTLRRSASTPALSNRIVGRLRREYGMPRFEGAAA